MGAIHYLTLTGNYGLTDSNFFDILKGKQLFGVSAGYGMDSIFGPLEISLGYSNQTDKGSCFVNLGYYFLSNLVKKNIITLQGRQILAILLRVIQYFQKAKEETASQ